MAHPANAASIVALLVACALAWPCVRADSAGAWHRVPVTPACQSRLDAFCNNVTDPAVQRCYSAMRAQGFQLPLVARWGTDDHHQPRQWRCYSPSSLTANQSRYANGTAYCTMDAPLADALMRCRGEVDVFPFGYKGVHEYRIPLLLHIPGSGGAGVLLAFAEARIYSSNDRGPKHLALRRSTDGGATWGPVQWVVSDASTNPDYDGLNLGAAVYDPASGAVVVLYTECAHACPIAQLLSVRSTDAGVTWSAGTNLTDAMVAGGMSVFAPGPGTGVVTSSGRLVVPGWYKDLGSTSLAGSAAVLSDDGGRSWKVGGKVKGGPPGLPNECQAAVLGNGSLLLNMRNEDPSACHCRLLARSDDGGGTWVGLRQAHELTDPACQGSTISVPAASPLGGGGPSVLYFSNADNADLRINGTLHRSVDGGATWGVVEGLDPAGFSYSGLAALNASWLGVVWESTTVTALNIRFMALPTGATP